MFFKYIILKTETKMKTVTLSQTGSFVSPEDKKKAFILLSFLALLMACLAAMTALLPAGSDVTTAFIFNYYVVGFALLLVYSLFTRKRKLVLGLSAFTGIISVASFVCNFYVNYERDFHGAVNLRPACAIVLVIMVCVSISRFIRYKMKQT